MYVRRSVRRKSGKVHTYWRLVRSVRRNGKAVQEAAAQLGELDARGRARAKDLARQITGRGDHADLFEEPAERDERVAVSLDQVRLERGLRWGLRPKR